METADEYSLDTEAGIALLLVVDVLSDTPSTSRMHPTVFRYPFLATDVADRLATVAAMGRVCISSLFLSLAPRPASPRATTVLERPFVPRLARPWPEWVHPNDTDPLEVLDHPAVAGVVDGTASDCLPT